MKQLGLSAVDAAQSRLDYAIAIIHVRVAHREILLIEAAQVLEQIARRQQASASHGGIFSARADEAHIAPVVWRLVEEGMTGQPTMIAMHDAGMLDRLIVEIQARADGADA